MIGRIIGNRYEIVEKLGGGGMALVYKARDQLLSRMVTIKVLREQLAGDADFIKRFRREAQAVARLSHPNIVSIYDVGEDKEIHYLVMEYIDGKNLKQLIQERGKLSPLEAVDFALQICEALEHAHENSIIHRDIKPHNILITKNGKVKVTDFGIAQAATGVTMTYSGHIIGSVQYISPEQARGEVASIHTDLYSAGIVLYEMVTGRLPFDGDTAIGIAMKHIQEEFSLPDELAAELPPELEAVISKALAKKPEDRYESAAAMKKALKQVQRSLEDGLAAIQLLPRVHSSKRNIASEPRTRRTRAKPFAWVLIILLLALLPVMGYWGLQKYLAVSEEEMPDLLGMPLSQAEKILRQLGLQWEVSQERHDNQIPAKHVLAQRPGPGELVKKSRIVELDVSLGPQMVKVPDVIGLSEREAKVEIANAGLLVAEPVKEEHDEKMAEGYVFKQNPNPHEQVPRGSSVELVISLGPELQYIAMPNLIAKSLQEAQAILEENRLRLGEVNNQVSYDYFPGQVIHQDIAPGDQVLQKTAVNLSISLGPGPAPQVANVEVLVEDDGEKHQIRIVVIDRKGEHEEYNHLHEPGDFIRIPVAYYGNGIVRVYEDDQAIYEAELP